MPRRQFGRMNFGPRKMLQRAHRLMEVGDHTNAAVIFERLARGAHDRGILKTAPYLYLQAARANLLAGKTDRGVGMIYQGLETLAESQRWLALQRAGRRSVEELTVWGLSIQATELAGWLKETLPKDALEERLDQVQPRRGQLPLKCSNCGGTLRSDEVEWIDRDTAACPYCGSTIQNE
jgi:DNA-directed RNA polymerase subunit RPC12/RpoP